MNTKRFLLASLAVFVSLQILDMIIHGPLLGSAYENLKEVWRPDMADVMWVMFVTSAVFSLVFVFIFTKGYEGKGIMEGIRYGFWMGLIVIFVGSFNQFAVYPIPYGLTWQWIIYGMIELMIVGAVTALIYKPSK